MQNIFRILLLVFIIFSISSQGQVTTEWQNPIPTGNCLKKIISLNKDTVISVGNVGTILRSINGGQTWTVIPSGVTTNLFSIFFLNNSIGWTGGENGTLLKTTDGGLNWNLETFPDIYSTITSIYFVNSTTGYISANFMTSFSDIYKTTNGGVSWTMISQWQESVNQIQFVTPLIGWCIGDAVRKTIDGGSTWITQWPSLSFVWHDIEMIDSLRGWIVGSYGKIARTDNGGSSWNAQTSNTTYTLNSIELFNDSSAITTGFFTTSLGNNVMTKTTDKGQNWQSISITPYWLLNDMSFANDSLGWGVGIQGNIFKTIDGGQTWNNFYGNGRMKLEKVAFSDSIHGVAGSMEGVLYQTSDGGKSWNFTNMFGAYITKIYTPYKDTIYLSCLSKFYHSFDGGLTWSYSNTPESFGGFFFINRLKIIALGDEERIYKSQDGGYTWSMVGSGGGLNTPAYTDIIFTDSLNGWLVGGNNSKILRTYNGGITWAQKYITGWNDKYYSISSVDPHICVAAGSEFAYTLDDGATWNIGSYSYLASSVFLTDPVHGYSVGGSGEYQKIDLTTLNSWPVVKVFDSGNGMELNDVYFVNSSSGWMAGENSSILHLSAPYSEMPVISSNGNSLISTPAFTYQ